MSIPDDHDELEVLRQQNLLLAEENARLKRMLGLGEPEDSESEPESTPSAPTVDSASPAHLKIGLFRSLFHGREDVYAKRWQSRTGASGYAPVCANEWKSGLCDKRRVKCAECANRELVELDDVAIQDHLTGRSTLGVYPMLEDEICWFLAIDFDDATWREDVAAFRAAASGSSLSCHVEISRSGSGAHAWLFFAEPIPASLARRLGTALLTLAARRRHVLSLRSYDRLFPSQDTLPRGGFGNLIALPLQHEPRSAGRSVFVDEDSACEPETSFDDLSFYRRL